ncbi:MAG: DNA replication/repair protein RecF [Bacillota bacterium]|nr:DNA replication/repair protein RecF [Bacillota bacterium]
MYLKNLELNNFRNYGSFSVEWDPGINIICGSNAKGKTNLLEAIYFLSTFSSFRRSGREELIKMGCDLFFISGEFFRCGLSHTIKAAYSRKKKSALKLDNDAVHRLGDIVGQLNAVVFSPDDLFMVKGDPGERRRFLDREIIQMSPVSYSYFQRYNKILRQRNNLLKEIRDRSSGSEVLNSFDSQLAEIGAYILYRRKEALDRLLPLTRLTHRKITGGKEELILLYKGGLKERAEDIWNSNDLGAWQDAYGEILREKRGEDIRRGTTTFGPHRDDLSFFVNDRDLKKYGSQGQQRTAVLSLKIGELELMKGQRGEYPLLLLDDVLSELDQERREALIRVVNQRVQTFITGTKEPAGLEAVKGKTLLL